MLLKIPEPFEEAISDILKVKPEPKPAKREKARASKRAGQNGGEQ